MCDRLFNGAGDELSSLSWIDFDDVERERARRLIAMFAERATRDEMGLGPIRDSIADRLFPGTNTLHTRLRYVFFVPWILQLVEADRGSPDSRALAKTGRKLEIQLIFALQKGGESRGVIGSSARWRLKRLPSELYWSALQSWGICVFQGSQHDYFAALPHVRRKRRRAGSSSLVTWHKGLPSTPPGFLERAEFGLRPDEAGFLVDRIVASHPRSLLAHLARNRRSVQCGYVWTHPDRASFPASAGRIVAHAEVFSEIMLGASLLYNFMLAGRRDWDEKVEHYRSRISTWKEKLEIERVLNWKLDDFWLCVRHPNHRIHEGSRHFVTRWVNLVRSQRGEILDDNEARRLVQNREQRLKGRHSRFINRSALDHWGGSSGSDRLSFRWAQVRSHLGDMADA